METVFHMWVKQFLCVCAEAGNFLTLKTDVHVAYLLI